MKGRPKPPATVAAVSTGSFDAEEQRAMQRAFATETQAHLAAAEQAVEALSHGPDGFADRASCGSIADLFRAIHTIKGGAGTVGLPSVTAAAHAMEDRIEALTRAAFDTRPAVLASLRADLDKIRRLTVRFAREEPAAGTEPSVPRTTAVSSVDLFARLERLVQQAAALERKEVRFEALGADALIDKSLVERIGDPLSQLLRNAVAHGIESRATRSHHGKAVQGRIRLRAELHGAKLVLEVEDDGAGIDPAVVKQRAIALGRVTPERAATLSDTQAADLIFEPGFSTRPEADRLAGRGIGLDVVRFVVAQLGGQIEVHSQVGIGTRFVIRLPKRTG